jgi:hypothetical protein
LFAGLITFECSHLYHKMKLKPINVLEIIVSLIFIIAHLLKGLLPYTGLETALSGGILCFLYFYLGVYTLRSPEVQTGYRIIYGLIFGTAVIGMIYCFQSWPYGNFFMILAMTLLSLIAVIRLVALYLLKKSQIMPYNKGILIRYSVLFVVSIYAYLTYKFK